MGDESLCCVSVAPLASYMLAESAAPQSNFEKMYQCRVSGAQHSRVGRVDPNFGCLG